MKMEIRTKMLRMVPVVEPSGSISRVIRLRKNRP